VDGFSASIHGIQGKSRRRENSQAEFTLYTVEEPATLGNTVLLFAIQWTKGVDSSIEQTSRVRPYRLTPSKPNSPRDCVTIAFSRRTPIKR
jgi:hypothetical protein